MIYDKVPLSAAKLSELRELLHGGSFRLLRQCMEADMQSKRIDANNLRYEAAGKVTADEAAKKEAQAKLIDDDATRIARVIHYMDRLAATNDFFTITIQP